MLCGRCMPDIEMHRDCCWSRWCLSAYKFFKSLLRGRVNVPCYAFYVPPIVFCIGWWQLRLVRLPPPLMSPIILQPSNASTTTLWTRMADCICMTQSRELSPLAWKITSFWIFFGSACSQILVSWSRPVPFLMSLPVEPSWILCNALTLREFW